MGNIGNFNRSGDDDFKEIEIDSKIFMDEMYEDTTLANCLIAPTESKTLAINKNKATILIKQFHNIVSMIGPPGVGKSTLASAMYNVMRNDQSEYFAISDAMESFTRGIWSINSISKTSKAKNDKIDVLDLEGIDNDGVIHYLVVVAMVLSKAKLLCSGKRFKFSMFDTLQCGFRLFKEYKISVPKPIFYIQVPDGQNEFKLRKGIVTKDGLIQYVKTKYPALKDCEMRIFSLPMFNENRFETQYLSAVNALVNELQEIDEKIRVEDRVKYTYTVVQALNNNSPSVVTNINLTFFKNEINSREKLLKQNAILSLRNKASAKLLQKKTSFEEFCADTCSNVNGIWLYGLKVKEQAIALAYYDENNIEHQKIIDKLGNNNYFISAKNHCEDIYKVALNRYKSDLVTQGHSIMVEHTKYFVSFIDRKLEHEKSKIHFHCSTHLGYKIYDEIEQRKLELKTELITKTEHEFQIPADYLDIDIDKKWETAINTLKIEWDKMVATALVDKVKVRVSGNLQCPSCAANHSDGLGHKECGSNAIWYWVDSKTQRGVCDCCKKLRVLGGVCCGKCETSLNARVIPMR